MTDPYRLLNVARDADPEAIKQAYRTLAKALHPDRNLGDRETEQRFKDVTEAYTLLSDKKSRRDYDRGRIDAAGQPIRPPFGQKADHQQDGGRGSKDGETLFGRLVRRFARAGRAEGAEQPARPSAQQGSPDGSPEKGQPHRLDVAFVTAVLGGKQRLIQAAGTMIEIDIPPGTDDKAMLRLKGQGHPGRPGEPPGDLLVQIRVSDHPFFTRRGQDLHLDLPVSLKEALLGARVRTPTIEGSVWLNVPADANSGQMLRLKGKGVADRAGRRGDQYVRLMVMLPKNPKAAVAADLKRLAEHDDDGDIRAHLDGVDR